MKKIIILLLLALSLISLTGCTKKNSVIEDVGKTNITVDQKSFDESQKAIEDFNKGK